MVLLFPTASLGLLLKMHRPAALALLFGVVNTVAAYGAFGYALEIWEVSRVSSVVAAAPLFTLLGSSFVAPEPLNTLSVVGALCVVAGSMISALGKPASKSF
jgi:drug/metabolite transporter (DMT)-like permease